MTNKITIFEINNHLDNICDLLKPQIINYISTYGFNVETLSIESINVPQEDTEKLNSILQKKAEYEQLGDYQYRVIRGYDVAEGVSKNGSTAGMILGTGIGAQLSKGGEIVPSNDIKEENITVCEKCGFKIRGDVNFCPNCGNKVLVECQSCHKKIGFEMNF